jgi:hypothetical protein
MALGNGNPKQGDKGSNWSYQFKSLTQLKNIKDAIDALTSVTGSAQDYEAKIVMDAAGDTFQEVRIYNPDTATWETPIYYKAGETTTSTPVAPITYLTKVILPTGTQTPIVNKETGTNTTIADNLFYSVSIANIGPDAIDFDNGATNAAIDPGVEVSFTAETGKKLGGITITAGSGTSVYYVSALTA